MAQKSCAGKKYPIKIRFQKGLLEFFTSFFAKIGYKYSIQIKMLNELQNPRFDSTLQRQRIVVYGSQVQAQQLFDAFIRRLITLQIRPFVITQEDLSQEGLSPFLNDENLEHCKTYQKSLFYNRKQKSLSQLTRKFIQNFQGAKQTTLILDKVTRQMNVQRRRIYDIINIMESLKVVGKIRKNVYEWKGLKQAIKTIKQIQSSEAMVEQTKENEKVRKQRSLQALAGQFLRIFSTKKYPMTLQEASSHVLAQEYQEMRKTKIRRLYDIVNVFKCMGLVKKIKRQGSKPGYMWMGCESLEQIISQKLLKTTKTTSTRMCEQQDRQIRNQQHQLQHESIKQFNNPSQLHIYQLNNQMENQDRNICTEVCEAKKEGKDISKPKKNYLKTTKERANIISQILFQDDDSCSGSKGQNFQAVPTQVHENQKLISQLEQQHKEQVNFQLENTKAQVIQLNISNSLLKDVVPSQVINSSSSFFQMFISSWVNNQEGINIDQLTNRFKSAVFKLSQQQQQDSQYQHCHPITQLGMANNTQINKKPQQHNIIQIYSEQQLYDDSVGIKEQ